jgi:glycosyltransferase involved in cell wall biosynthesis/4-amino-4-deoxy-L-arabinose transferase-like glycosyltransferase
MRILILDYKDGWHNEAGGAQHYVEEIAHEWVRLGHEVTIFSCRSERPRSETVEGVRYIREGTKFTVFHSAKVYLARYGDHYDAVLDSVNQRPFLAHEVVGDKSTSLVHHLGLELWDFEFGFPFDLIGRQILEPEWMRRLRLAPRVLAVSPSTAHSLADYGIVSDGIVPPALSPTRAARSRKLSPKPRLLFIGRLVKNKRPLDAVAAFELLRSQFPNLSMDVIGDGYLLGDLQKHASPELRVWGYVSDEDKVALIKRADLLLVTSVREGWGIVVSEAAALGVPAVGYNIPGLRDSIEDGVTGLLTEESPAALAEGVSELLHDPPRWSQMRVAASKRATSWTWSNAAASLLDFMTAPPTREAWMRADPDRPPAPVEVPAEPEPKDWFDTANRSNSVAFIVAAIAIFVGLALRVYTAQHMAWREDEIVYVQWTGSWFSNHLFSYLFQFHQHIYPPKSEYFANPPFAMWIFGVAIRIGHAFSASALLSARLADVVISVVTNVVLFKTVRRWLGSGVAAFAASAFALLPLAITTGASAFIEPTLTLLAVLALDGYLRLREEVTWPRAVYLATVLGFILVTKLSLIGVFALIGLSALIYLNRSGRRAIATGFVAISLLLPLVLWTGYRTPSQYSGVIGFVSSKFATITGVAHLRFPFSLLSDIPLVVLVAWLTVLVCPLVFEPLRNRAPTNMLFIAVLPAVGVVELMITAPTSLDYQLLPLLPFVVVPAGWLLRRIFIRPHRRLVTIAMTLILLGEFGFMLFGVPSRQLSLSASPAATVIRDLSPNIDVPYGTGSEELPELAHYINTKLPRGVRVAATYANFTLGRYLRGGRSAQPWSTDQPLFSLAQRDCQYGVVIGHYAPTWTIAAQSVVGMRPVFSVHLANGSYASIYRVP